MWDSLLYDISLCMLNSRVYHIFLSFLDGLFTGGKQGCHSSFKRRLPDSALAVKAAQLL